MNFRARDRTVAIGRERGALRIMHVRVEGALVGELQHVDLERRAVDTIGSRAL